VTVSEEALWFEHRTRVRFQDVDAAGIVFFARVFDLFHDAYVEALRAGGVELSSVLAANVWAAPLTSCDAQFRRPLRFGDEITVELRAELVERDLIVRYRVRSSRDRAATLATGSTKHAFVDCATFARIDPPAEVRAALAHRSS
jgi:YbgC/YbaW family acyl-CoA thioester hydrolase